MSKRTQKPLYASGLYIALSLCALAVVCLGAYFALNRLIEEPSTAPIDRIPSIGTENTTPQTPQITPEPNQTPTPPTVDSSTDKDGDSDTDVDAEPQETQRVYMSPVTSETILKEFNVKELLYSKTMNDFRAHTGIDFTAPIGASVCALTDGVIESIHADPLMGQTIVIDHGDGLKSVYQNLALEIPDGIIAGTEVHAGDLIGAVGDTAIIECAEESHLHFEIQKNEACVNPADYLKINV